MKLEGSDPPGATPLTDLSGLRQLQIRTRSDLHAAEAENIRGAFVRYLIDPASARRVPFDEAWMRRLHLEMFGTVWSWAGSYRRSATNIGIDPLGITVAMHELHGDLTAWRAAGLSVLEQSARLHHRAVQVHPFLNGNGCWARMVANIWLRRNGLGIVAWPEAGLGATSLIRGTYLSAVRLADAGDIAPLVELHARYLEPRVST